MMLRENGVQRNQNKSHLNKKHSKRSSKRKKQTLRFETLEPRKLLAADGVAQPNLIDQGVAEVQQIPVETLGRVETTTVMSELDLPVGLPAHFSTSFDFQGQTLTLQLDKSSVYGPNTRFLVSDGQGGLTEIDPGVDRTYLGGVAEDAGYTVSAVLTEEGLFASVYRPGEPSIVIEPDLGSTSSRLHTISSMEFMSDHSHDHSHSHAHGHRHSHSHSHQGGLTNQNPFSSTPDSPQVAASTSTITTSTVSVPPVAASIGGATLPPSRVMNVYEFELGVEIGWPAFDNNYNNSLSLAQSVVAGIPNNLNARFLHAAGIRHRLGTVIIRQSASEQKFSVANGNDTNGLNAFRDYWNSNPDEVGNTHDIAVFHVRGAPSGLAYVNNVGTSNRYLLSASNGATSWADGTLAHEVGHQWNLPHVGDIGSMFYESKPRSNGNAAGGSDLFVSIMHGSGTHNIGRLATDEANRVFNARQNKLGFGDLISNPGPIKPFGHRDAASANGSPITIDVIANDFDVNNDVLNVELRDTVSQQGATISISQGTGPGGRDEILYTPPNGVNGTDFFHYNVIDSTGRRDWGAVYVENFGPTVVDLTRTEYFYDLGTPTSVVFSGNSDPYERISEATFGDISFVSNGPNPIESRDRGSSPGVNDLNRDHIRMRSPSTFKHALADGVYEVLFTVGDAAENTNSFRLTAEDSVTLTTSNHTPATFTNYVMQDVQVTDGFLTVDIENLGFSANITRIIIKRTGDAEIGPTASSLRVGGNHDGTGLDRPDLLGTVSVAFSEDVTATAGGAFLLNVSNGGIPASTNGVSFSYNPFLQLASWDFSTLNTPLSPGYYDFVIGPSVTSVETGLPVVGDGDFGVHSDRIYLAIPGDTDLDGDVDIIDPTSGGDGFTFVQNLGTQSGATWADGDFNGDGRVDILGDGFVFVNGLGSNVQLPPSAPQSVENSSETAALLPTTSRVDDAQPTLADNLDLKPCNCPLCAATGSHSHLAVSNKSSVLEQPSTLEQPVTEQPFTLTELDEPETESTIAFVQLAASKKKTATQLSGQKIPVLDTSDKSNLELSSDYDLADQVFGGETLF